MGETENNQNDEKRGFPRMDAECAVLYAVGTSKDWKVGILINMSATGLMMKTSERLLKNIGITIVIKPGQNKLVPEIEGKGKITRCTQINEDEYEVSCKLTKIKNIKK